MDDSANLDDHEAVTFLGRLKQAIWILPLALAALVAVLGWWGNGRLRETIEGQLTAQLSATLNANVTALGIWTSNQTRLATSLAEDSSVQTLAGKIFQLPPPSRREPRPPPEVGQFISLIQPRLAELDYEVAQLVNTNFVVVANSRRGQWAAIRSSPTRTRTSLPSCSPLASRSSSRRSNRNCSCNGVLEPTRSAVRTVRFSMADSSGAATWR